jgi:anti-sigma factor RsiW
MMRTSPDERADHPEPGPHAETRELLPWLANGTLTGAELARVEAHLAACPACRAQLEWERGLHAAGQPAPPLSAQQGFAALLPRLGPQEAPAAERGRRAGLAPANDPRWLRAVAAVQLGVIVVLGMLLARPGGGEASYRALGARPAAEGNIVVSVDPATPERELRRILQASGTRVVDGPTASGAYVLAAAPAETREALRRLRAEPAVVLAEPLAVGSGPGAGPGAEP